MRPIGHGDAGASLRKVGGFGRGSTRLGWLDVASTSESVKRVGLSETSESMPVLATLLNERQPVPRSYAMYAATGLVLSIAALHCKSTGLGILSNVAKTLAITDSEGFW